MPAPAPSDVTAPSTPFAGLTLALASGVDERDGTELVTVEGAADGAPLEVTASKYAGR
jgi:hypothetical protein